MAGRFCNYDHKRVIGMWTPLGLAPITFEGYADEGEIVVTYDNDQWMADIGTDGEEGRSRDNRMSATMTAPFMQQSTINQVFGSVALADLYLGLGVGPLLIKDYGGTGLVESRSAYLIRIPEWKRAAKQSTVVWGWKLPNAVINHGYNFEPGQKA